MQKARLRTGWKNKQKRISIAEFANALSAICWRIALNAAKNLHQEDFIYRDDQQRLDVIAAYLFFLIHCSDRQTAPVFDQEQRLEFVTRLSLDCQKHYLQNALELTGVLIDDGHFIEQLNHTTDSLSATGFGGGEPGFDMYRVLGAHIQRTMGDSQTNKWVIDQIMDIDGPAAFELYNKSFIKLQRSAGFDQASGQSENQI